jgi:1-acyl-sn-glycerol-3-phosphate acyltransferase
MLTNLNGCIYVDRKSKKSGENAFKQSIEGINKGYNMIVFPEGTWNLLQSQPILPRKWGDIKIAQETGRPIIPIVMEYNGKNCFVKSSDPIYFDKNDDLKSCDEKMYDIMSTLKYDIWSSDIYKDKFEEISYEEWLRETLKGYKYFDTEYEQWLIYCFSLPFNLPALTKYYTPQEWWKKFAAPMATSAYEIINLEDYYIE